MHDKIDMEPWRRRLMDAVKKASEKNGVKPFSLRAGMSESAVGKFLKDGTTPLVTTFLKICDAANVSPVYILTGYEINAQTDRLVRMFSAASPQQGLALATLLEHLHPGISPSYQEPAGAPSAEDSEKQ